MGLRTEDVAWGQRLQRPLEAGKAKATGSPLRSFSRILPCQHLACAEQTSDSQNRKPTCMSVVPKSLKPVLLQRQQETDTC